MVKVNLNDQESAKDHAHSSSYAMVGSNRKRKKSGNESKSRPNLSKGRETAQTSGKSEMVSLKND